MLKNIAVKLAFRTQKQCNEANFQASQHDSEASFKAKIDFIIMSQDLKTCLKAYSKAEQKSMTVKPTFQFKSNAVNLNKKALQ